MGSASLVASVVRAVGDGGRKAYTAIVWGETLSCEMVEVVEAEAVGEVEGNMSGTVMQGAVALPQSETSSRTKGTCRNLGGLTSGRAAPAAPVRVGKARSRSR